MDEVEIGGVCENRRRGAGRWVAPLAVATIVSIVSLAGFWIWYDRSIHEPVYLIKHGTPFERLQAAADLGVLKEDTDIDRVMAVLAGAMDDGDIAIRSTSEEALGAFTGQVLERAGSGTSAQKEQTGRRVAFAIRKLTRGLSDPEPIIRASAAFALGRLAAKNPVDLPSQLVAALEDESIAVRQAATTALNKAQLTSSVVPALIKSLANSDSEARYRAMEILGRLGPAAEPAVPALLAMLSEPLDSNKAGVTPVAFLEPACGAAIALGKIGPDREIIAGLTVMLSSDDPERASSAASGLARLGPAAASAIPALITAYDRVLRSEQHVLGQSAVAMALGNVGPGTPAAAEVIAVLTRALDSKDTWVCIGAVQALGNFGPDAFAVVTKLREFEQSPLKELQEAARKSVALIETSPNAAVRDVKPQR